MFGVPARGVYDVDERCAVDAGVAGGLGDSVVPTGLQLLEAAGFRRESIFSILVLGVGG